MAGAVTVVVNQDGDDEVIRCVAGVLRANNQFAAQVRAFARTVAHDQHPQGIGFQPQPGQLLICHFGLGFQQPEMTKTRPVLVISPHQRVWTRLSVVLPISSKRPDPIEPFHYQLPKGLVPGKKYEEAWIKGDMVMAVGYQRLDRIKIGFREYASPTVPAAVLKEARRCVLHGAGMHALTVHW